MRSATVGAMADERVIRAVPDWLRAARAVTVLTGAGISTDSGIPDFRGRKCRLCGPR